MSSDKKPANRLLEHLVTCENMKAKFTDSLNQSWRIDGVFPYGGLALCYGQSQSFKSFLALDMGLAIASGREWHGREVEQAPVLYIAAEGQTGVLKRVEAWKRQHKVETVKHFEMLTTAVAINEPRQLMELIDLIMQRPAKPGLVIIDTLNRCMDGHESDTGEMTGFINACGKIYQDAGTSVMVIHHSGKDVTRGARGSNALPAAADMIYQVDRAKKTEYLAALKCEKFKDSEPFRDMFFDMIEVDTEVTDKKGRSVTSLVPILNAEIQPAPDKRKLRGKRLLVFNALAAAIKQCGESGASIEQWRDAYYQADDSETKRKNFCKEHKELINTNKVNEVAGYYFIADDS